MAGKTVLQMAQELLELPGDAPGAGRAAGRRLPGFAAVKGLGPAKRAELMAVLELARRATAQQLREREVFSSPKPSSTICSCIWRPGRTRCLPCCFWTVRTACWLWKKCFAVP
jgi:DNA repair protein RadC